MNILKKLASDTAVYGVSSLLGRLLNYLLVPFHTSIFDADKYGVVSVFYANAALLNVLYTFGIETAFFRFSTKNPDKQEVYNLALTAIMTVSIVFSAFIFLFAQNIANLVDLPENANFIRWFSLILAIDAIVVIPFGKLRLEGKSKKFASIRIFNIALNIGLNFFFLYFCKNISEGNFLIDYRHTARIFYQEEIGIGYVFLANLLANICVIPLLYKEFSCFRFNFDLQKLKPMLIYAYPILFTGIAGAINEVADRNLLAYWLPANFYGKLTTPDAIGVYSACYKLSIFISLAVQAFKYAAEPIFFGQAQDKNSPQLFAKVMHFFVIACAFMYLAVSLNLDWLQLFLRKEVYRTGIEVVPILLLANVFLGIYFNLTIWFKITDKTYFGTYFGIFGALITIGANFLLIPFLGYMGSAMATLLCYFSMTILCYVYGQRNFYVPYRLKSGIFYLFFATFLIFISLFVKTNHFWADFFIQNFLVIVFLVVVFLKERRRK